MHYVKFEYGELQYYQMLLSLSIFNIANEKTNTTSTSAIADKPARRAAHDKRQNFKTVT